MGRFGSRRTLKSGRSKELTTGSSRRLNQMSFRFKFFGISFVIRPPRLKHIGITLLLSVPTILGLYIAILWSSGLFSESEIGINSKYRTVALENTVQKKENDLVFRRRLSFDSNDVDVWVKYIELLRENEQTLKAKLILTDLVEVRELRDARIHTKFAEVLMMEEPFSAVNLIKAEKILRLVAASDNPTDSVLARRKLSLLYLTMNNRESAYRILEPVMIDYPVAGSEALWIQWSGGKKLDRDLVEKIMTRLDSYVLSQVVAIPYETALAKTRMFIMLGQEKEARDWLKAQPGMSDTTLDMLNKEIEEMVLVSSIVNSVDSKTPDWPKLESLLKRDSNHPVWTQIAVSLWSDPNRVGVESARSWVQQQLDNGTASINLLTQATMITAQNFNARGTKPEDSLIVRDLYRKLLKRSPDNYVVLNNLAMLIYKFEPDHLPEGLTYAQRALEIYPNSPQIHDTLGQILVRMGRVDEALAILETCVDRLPMEWNLHNSLAQIYEHKGMSEKAKAHRLVMSKIQKPLDAANYENLKFSVSEEAKNLPSKDS